MHWQEEFKKRLTTANEAVKAIKPGNRVVVGHAYGQPQHLVKAMIANKDAYADVEIVHMVSLSPAPYCNQDMQKHFIHNSFFVGVNSREAVNGGWAKFTPCYFSEIPRLFQEGILPVDVTLCQLSPPDDNGNCSFGISVDYTKPAAKSGKIVIAQINDRMPRTMGDASIHVSELDYIVEYDEPLLELGREKTGNSVMETKQYISKITAEIDIGRYCSELIEYGSCLQLGIGAIPDAVLPFLTEKKDLGIHTEMFSDGVVDLVEKGIINGSRKNLHPGKLVASFLMGTKKLYDFVHENRMVEMYPVNYTNDPCIIGQNDKVVSINSCLQVDLLGQVASDTIGPVQFSGVGGQVDFIRGAARSKGGKSILAFPSTAGGGKVSRIVPRLDPGAVVTTSRCDVHYIVTEHGIADLRGKSVKERARQLIAIAHPDFRENLERELENLRIF
ncbi:MAG: acetyl-CoA hydrolase/transferase family protein [Sedimentisphaerales bacterium]|nr:acetyl-CoA hydrolase/transferase family protein [Sedimentisphaerales bacterium]